MSLQDVVSFEGERPHRRQRRAVEKRRRRRRRRTWSILLVSLIVVGGAVGGAWLGLKPIIASLTAPDDWTGAGTGEVVVVQIKPGASGAAMAATLADAGVVKTPKAFSKAYTAEIQSQSIQPGSYRLRKQMSAASAVALLLDPAAKLTVKVTIPEGKRLTQILDLIAKQTGLSRPALDAATKDKAALGLPDEAKGNLEGYLFPATYLFGPGATATEILREMIVQEQATMNKLGVGADKQRAVLIEASLIQAEAGRDEDMPKIARVLANRTAQKMPFSLDTTIHYATGTFTLFTSAKDLEIKSPYNTYKSLGLPPGPICSPGAAAIKAVLAPAEGTWLWFTTVNPDTGETRFASTQAQKDAMDAEWQKWQRAHPGQ